LLAKLVAKQSSSAVGLAFTIMVTSMNLSLPAPPALTFYVCLFGNAGELASTGRRDDLHALPIELFVGSCAAVHQLRQTACWRKPGAAAK